jgi:hypothetical protein
MSPILKHRPEPGRTVVFHPRIQPIEAPLGVPAYLRRHHPRFYRLCRWVYALERHNTRVIGTRLHCDNRRKCAEIERSLRKENASP